MTDALPGRGRQGADHHGLPERDLLRPRRVRDRRRRRDLLRRHRPHQAHARPRRRCSPGCRSRPRRSTRTATPSPTTRAGSSSRPTAPPVVRRNYILEQPLRRRPAGRRCHRRELQAALDEPVVLAGDRPLSLKAPQFTWQVRRQLDAILGDGRAGRDRRLHRDHDARLERPAARPSGGSRPRVDRPEPQAKDAGDRLLRSLKIGPSRTGAGSTPCAARTSTTRRSSRSTTGPATSWPTPAARATTSDSLASRKFEPKYDVAGDGDAPARIGLEADPVRQRVRHRQAHAGQPPPRHHDRVRPRPELGAARRGPARARPGPRPQGAPVLAEHPGDPGARAGRQRGGRRPGRRRSGIRFTGGKRGLPPGRPRRRARDGRGPAARPDLGLRRRSPTAAPTSRRG